VRDGVSGTRLPVKAYIGTTMWVELHVDLVGSEVTMTGEPERVPALARVLMPDVEQHGYRAYPLVDHVADKVAATCDRYGVLRGSLDSRYKDLVDLVAIVIGASVEAQAQTAALASEALRRRITFAAAVLGSRPKPVGTGVRGGGRPVALAGRSHTR
jgi:hypothetical protein